MPICQSCGEKLGPYAAMCHMCGTPVPGAATVPAEEPTAAPTKPSTGRFCPSCGKTYAADFADNFCECGIELQADATPESSTHAPNENVRQEEGDYAPAIARPAPGTPCLVLYGEDKQPLGYFPLMKDATLIGRLDAAAGLFPDVDLADYLDKATARKVSRQHALILRSRATKAFCLRPLAGNTGTQLEADMTEPLQDYPLRSGARLVLGGAVRMKFEIA